MSILDLEKYSFENGRVIRELTVGRRSWRSSIDNKSDASPDGNSAWWQSYLRGATVQAEDLEGRRSPIRVVDAFSGCGGLTLGAKQAALAVGQCLESVAAIDVDEGALKVHQANFGTKHLLHTNASSLVDFHVNGSDEGSRFAYEPEILHSDLALEIGEIDLFLAGPPCQGHSNLNNKTRREDPRNVLFLTAVALAVGLKSRLVVIENVPEVVNDKSTVVSAAMALLKASGYRFVDAGVLAAHEIGGAQTRKRFFLIAAMDGPADRDLTLRLVASGLKRSARSVSWAIGDLMNLPPPTALSGVMDTVPALSEENLSRIEYLFKNNVHELPNEERPDCHKGGHTYPSVYGRMYPEKPAQTITTGFLTPGRGRYIHPAKPRVITPREAARIQAFPDSFRFVVNGQDPPRNALTKWIGDAVPPLLGYAAALPLFAGYNK